MQSDVHLRLEAHIEHPIRGHHRPSEAISMQSDAHLRLEAHIEHPICLIEHEDLASS